MFSTSSKQWTTAHGVQSGAAPEQVALRALPAIRVSMLPGLCCQVPTSFPAHDDGAAALALPTNATRVTITRVCFRNIKHFAETKNEINH